MKKLLSSLLLASAFLAGVGLAGCQNMGSSSMSASSAKSTYVLVTPGNGAPYTVMVPAGNPDGAMVIGKMGAPMCAECVNDAKVYALTGKMDPVCKMCGAHREAVTMAPVSGHN